MLTTKYTDEQNKRDIIGGIENTLVFPMLPMMLHFFSLLAYVTLYIPASCTLCRICPGVLH